MWPISTSQKSHTNEAKCDTGNAGNPLRTYTNENMPVFIKISEITRETRETTTTTKDR